MLAASQHLSFFTARAWIFPGMNQIHRRQLAHAIVVMYCNPGGNCQEVHCEYGDEKAAHEIELLMQKWAAGKSGLLTYVFHLSDFCHPIFFFNNCALIATMMVLKLIKTAPTAGLKTKVGYRTPTASGMAMAL